MCWLCPPLFRDLSMWSYSSALLEYAWLSVRSGCCGFSYLRVNREVSEEEVSSRQKWLPGAIWPYPTELITLQAADHQSGCGDKWLEPWGRWSPDDLNCPMPSGHSPREGDWPSLWLSLVFRECPGKGEQRQWFNSGRLSGVADFGVSSKVPGLGRICLISLCTGQKRQP